MTGKLIFKKRLAKKIGHYLGLKEMENFLKCWFKNKAIFAWDLGQRFGFKNIFTGDTCLNGTLANNIAEFSIENIDFFILQKFLHKFFNMQNANCCVRNFKVFKLSARS